MKTFREFLFETPLDLDKPAEFTEVWETYLTKDEIDKLTHLISLKEIGFYQYSDDNIIGVVKDKGKFKIIFELEFKDEPFEVPDSVKQPLFVDTIDLAKEFRGEMVSKTIYNLLANMGHTVVSDTVQYTGGRKIWEDIAKSAPKNKLKVKIYNILTKTFLSDDNGNPIEFDGFNIDHNEIWTKMPNTKGQTIVLTLSK